MANPDSGGDAIARLVSREAIVEVLHRYCRGLDRMDRALASTVWHAGGTADYGEHFQGTGEGFLDWVWQAHAGMHAHSHQITNVLVDVRGDTAVSEAYVTVALRIETAPGEPADIVDRGRYLDRWSNRDGRWAIEHRRYVSDFQSLYPVPPGAGLPATGAGRRDRDDPSYELFES